MNLQTDCDRLLVTVNHLVKRRRGNRDFTTKVFELGGIRLSRKKTDDERTIYKVRVELLLRKSLVYFGKVRAHVRLLPEVFYT